MAHSGYELSGQKDWLIVLGIGEMCSRFAHEVLIAAIERHPTRTAVASIQNALNSVPIAARRFGFCHD
jgi:hypothetical protein